MRWRQTFDNRSLSGTNQTRGTFGVIVVFEIKRKKNAFACFASHGALNIDQSFAWLKNSGIQILRIVD